MDDVLRIGHTYTADDFAELLGATILDINDGERLMFVVNARLPERTAADMLGRLQAFLPGIGVAICDNTSHVYRETDDDHEGESQASEEEGQA